MSEALRSPDHAFSRFTQNFEQGQALPIFPLCEPDENGGLGAILVGDYVANDAVSFFEAHISDFHDKWLVVSTTQSDTVPTTVTKTDLNIFSNKSGEAQYQLSPASKVPYSLDLADGLFIDPAIFQPPQDDIPMQSDILYAAKWYPTKRTELLIETAALYPDIQILIYGWLMASERKRQTSLSYRDEVMAKAALLSNVMIMNAEDVSGDPDHINPDGSTVLGPLTKEQMRDQLYHPARTGIYLSEETEAVNRFATEMLACNKPMIVALPTHGGMERFMVDGVTSRFCDRTPEGIADAYYDIRSNEASYRPREAFLEFGGREEANKTLRALVTSLAEDRGKRVNTDGWHTYGGDLWTMPECYNTIR